MIEPYASVIDEFIDQFLAIGFSKSADSDYGMTFSNGSVFIEIATERYYHPSIIIRFIDGKGVPYSLRIIRDILSSQQLVKDSLALTQIKSIYGLDDSNSDANLRANGVIAYCRLAIEQLLDFLSAHKKEWCVTSFSFQAEYSIREKARMKDFGI